MASGRPCGMKPFPKHFPVALLLIYIDVEQSLKKTPNMVDNRDYKMERKKVDPSSQGQCERVSSRGAVLHLWVLTSFSSSCGERRNSKIEVGGKNWCLSPPLFLPVPPTHPPPARADFHYKIRVTGVAPQELASLPRGGLGGQHSNSKLHICT